METSGRPRLICPHLSDFVRHAPHIPPPQILARQLPGFKICTNWAASCCNYRSLQVMLLCFLALLLHTFDGRASGRETYAYQPDPQIPGSVSEPRFCFVVRTYWGHAEADGLQHFFASLQAQQIPE